MSEEHPGTVAAIAAASERGGWATFRGIGTGAISAMRFLAATKPALLVRDLPGYLRDRDSQPRWVPFAGTWKRLSDARTFAETEGRARALTALYVPLGIATAVVGAAAATAGLAALALGGAVAGTGTVVATAAGAVVGSPSVAIGVVRSAAPVVARAATELGIRSYLRPAQVPSRDLGRATVGAPAVEPFAAPAASRHAQRDVPGL